MNRGQSRRGLSRDPVPSKSRRRLSRDPVPSKSRRRLSKDPMPSKRSPIGSPDKKSKTSTVENEVQTCITYKEQGDIHQVRIHKPTKFEMQRVIISTHKPKKRKVKFMDWKTFHRLRVIYDFIDDLERDYPAICTVSVIGKSVEGRDIKMLKISNSNASNASVWMDGCIHPREWISTAVVTYLADVIVKNFTTHSTTITNKDWHIVPVLNPDGYEYTHTHDRMWRKNRAKYGGESVGVDLNRNFSYGWGNNGEEGSSEDPTHVFYRGPAPFSEPESIAVRDAILGSSAQFQVFLSFHSYYELIIFPWGYKKDPCPQYLRLLEAGTAMARMCESKRLQLYSNPELRQKFDTSVFSHVFAKTIHNDVFVAVNDCKQKAIYDSSGYTYKVGSTKDMTYFACGTSTDWSYAIAKIPYSYMIELRSRKHRFKLPKDQIIGTCIEIWSAVKCLMDFVDENPITKC